MTNLDSIFKSRDITLPTKLHLVKSGFSSGHAWMWKLDCEESWAPKNWCFWTVVLEKTIESPSDCKEIQLVHSEGDWSWVFFGRNDAKAETPVLWPPHAKGWFIGKDSDAGRDWGQEEKGMTEGKMTGWHHQLDGHEFGWTLGDSDGQGGLACCDSWGCKELDMTEWLNWLTLRLVLWLALASRTRQKYNFQPGPQETLRVRACPLALSLGWTRLGLPAGWREKKDERCVEQSCPSKGTSQSCRESSQQIYRCLGNRPTPATLHCHVSQSCWILCATGVS